MFSVWHLIDRQRFDHPVIISVIIIFKAKVNVLRNITASVSFEVTLCNYGSQCLQPTV